MAAEQVKKHYVLGVFPFLLGNRDFLFHSCDFCLYFIEKKYLILKYKYMYRIYQIFNLMEDENSYSPVHIFCEFLLSPKSQRK